MSRRCSVCGKGTVQGGNVPRKGLAKKKGGVGQHIGVRTKRPFKANILKARTLVSGTAKRVKVCTRCLRAGRLVKVQSTLSR